MPRSITRRRFLSSLVLGSSGALLAARSTGAATTAAKPGGTLIAGWEAEPGAFDNDIDRGAVTRTLLHNIYDRLVDRDMTVKANQPLVGNLATSWEISPDARIYTFKLRPGVKFHDGTPFDAEAVKFNIDRDSDPSHNYYNKAGAGDRVTLEAPGGGGAYRPEERDPKEVEADVAGGFVSEDCAGTALPGCDRKWSSGRSEDPTIAIADRRCPCHPRLKIH